ncbi:MAG: peptidoglycan DD-metalloendopeptidase family protein [Solobacterium sp.]|nr:peptidoglycan DD-metalloendopeptidase family protein [Solobacterium sp.]
MKRLLKLLLSLSFLLQGSFITLIAEETDKEKTEETGEEKTSEPAPASNPSEDYSDTQYWTDLCTSGETLTPQQKNSCMAFMQSQTNVTSDLNKKIKDIEAKRSEIAKDILVYAAQVAGYQQQAASLNGEIADLNSQIAVTEKKIQTMEEKIAQNEEEIDAAEEKIKDRMVIQQRTMRLNQYLDILMGAKTFDDFVRIANGINDITEYDTRTMEDLADKIDQLNRDIVEVEEEKENLKGQKEQVVAKQNEYLSLMYQAQVIEQELRNQTAELEALGNRYAAQIEEIQALMAEISEKLNEVSASPGWTYPVPGLRVNEYAGTWHYGSGGVHLGADFSGSAGVPVVAAGNGVILHSADGCSTGGLGNGCGANIGGSWGGGNQAYLLTKINGSLYAVKYLHMLQGSVIAKGTIVMAGDRIGLVGSTGNSSGPHCHIEVFYLGDASNFTKYAQNWDGDLAFGCGWGAAGLNRLCENGAGAPCRVKPESVFGG